SGMDETPPSCRRWGTFFRRTTKDKDRRRGGTSPAPDTDPQREGRPAALCDLPGTICDIMGS
ncbi:hypothetical protein RZO55_10340, partial [Clostridium boliviensis]